MGLIRSAAVLAAAAAALGATAHGAALAPPNDSFGSPTTISGEAGYVEATNVSATKEAGEPNHAGKPGGRSVWFTWIAPRSGHVALDTCGSDFDTLLAAYTGEALAALTAVAANDDACDAQSAVELDVTGGTAYRIAVDGANADVGDIVLAWAMMPVPGAPVPPNDQFESATPVGAWSGTADGTNLTATHQAGEPAHTPRGGSGSVWYRWTAPQTGAVGFKVCNASFDAVLAAYRGTSVAALTLLAAYDDECGSYSGIVFSVEAGVSYAVAVDGFGPAHRGTFMLTWAEWPLPPTAVVPPTVRGFARGGEVLTGELGQWRGTAPIAFTFWWERCQPVGIDCFAIAGTHGAQTIRIGYSESLRFAVRATNPAGSTTAYSARVNSPPGPPVMISPPVITGTPSVGATLRVVTYGEWRSEYPLEYREQWQRCRPGTTANCTNVFPPDEWEGGAYRVQRGDAGSVIRLMVTASHIAGSTTAVSAPTAVVPGAPPTSRHCVVPRLVGKTLRFARTLLRQANCRLGKLRRARSRRKAGLIVKQTPAARKRLPAGARVDVVVSLGRR